MKQGERKQAETVTRGTPMAHWSRQSPRAGKKEKAIVVCLEVDSRPRLSDTFPNVDSSQSKLGEEKTRRAITRRFTSQ